jgi:FMN phosphatase YigB (HAD superfamily)
MRPTAAITNAGPTGTSCDHGWVPSAVLLDFYGTVVASDLAVINRICAQVVPTLAHPVSVAEIRRRWVSTFDQDCAGVLFKRQRLAARDSLAQVLDSAGSPEDPDLLCAPLFDYWQRPALLDDAAAFLTKIRMPVCIVSNIDREDLDAALDHHRLTLAHVVTSDDVRSYKPRPECFLRGLELLGVCPEDALHVGDSLFSDVAGANRAGVPVAWLNRSAGIRPAEATLWAEVTDLYELAELLTGSSAIT